jgi:outer membrane lipoprotein carrier protein
LPVLLLLSLLPGVVLADAVDALNDALAPLDGLQGNFTQQQYDESGEILLESSGRFSVLRPDYFSWEIRAPDNQLVIATPEFIWHHDRDLETVTRRPLAAAGAMTPLQVLGGDVAVLRAAFTVTQVQDDTFILRPRGADAGFQELSLHLRNGEIASMEVLDNLDQKLQVEFSDLISNGELSPSDFAFTPPPEADLFFHE